MRASETNHPPVIPAFARPPVKSLIISRRSVFQPLRLTSAAYHPAPPVLCHLSPRSAHVCCTSHLPHITPLHLTVCCASHLPHITPLRPTSAAPHIQRLSPSSASHPLHGSSATYHPAPSLHLPLITCSASHLLSHMCTLYPIKSTQNHRIFLRPSRNFR